MRTEVVETTALTSLLALHLPSGDHAVVEGVDLLGVLDECAAGKTAVAQQVTDKTAVDPFRIPHLQKGKV